MRTAAEVAGPGPCQETPRMACSTWPRQAPGHQAGHRGKKVQAEGFLASYQTAPEGPASGGLARRPAPWSHH